VPLTLYTKSGSIGDHFAAITSHINDFSLVKSYRILLFRPLQKSQYFKIGATAIYPSLLRCDSWFV